MDVHPTPFAGKTQSLKSKLNRKVTEAPKIIDKEPPIHRQKRVFGTTRNPNVPPKTANENPQIKPLSGLARKQTKSAQTTSSSTESTSVPGPEATKKSPEKTKARSKKKSVCFQEKFSDNNVKNSPKEVDFAGGAKTPVRSPGLVNNNKPRVSGTPYMSAKRCSNCRFDRLETSSYWLSQIKLAESVGKHFVSAAFFHLAYESKAEPVRSLRVELKHYLARHEYLSADQKWRAVCESYGLLKDESNAVEVDSGLGKASESNGRGTGSSTHEQEQKEQIVDEEYETKNN